MRILFNAVSWRSLSGKAINVLAIMQFRIVLSGSVEAPAVKNMHSALQSPLIKGQNVFLFTIGTFLSTVLGCCNSLYPKYKGDGGLLQEKER